MEIEDFIDLLGNLLNADKKYVVFMSCEEAKSYGYKFIWYELNTEDILGIKSWLVIDFNIIEHKINALYLVLHAPIELFKNYTIEELKKINILRDSQMVSNGKTLVVIYEIPLGIRIDTFIHWKIKELLNFLNVSPKNFKINIVRYSFSEAF